MIFDFDFAFLTQPLHIEYVQTGKGNRFRQQIKLKINTMSKKQHFVKVDSSAFHQLVETIKSHELEDNIIQVKDLSLLQFLLETSDYDKWLNTISDEVKIGILRTHGIKNPDPNTLNVDKDMADFEYTPMQVGAVSRKFNRIAKSYNPATSMEITTIDVDNCGKVKDCIDLVIKAINS